MELSNIQSVQSVSRFNLAPSFAPISTRCFSLSGSVFLRALVKYSFAMVLLCTLSNAVFAEQVNLNTADSEALQYIPGIGPGKADEIIRVREELGGFKMMADLLAVPGIGEKTLINVKKYGALNDGVSVLTEEMQENPARMNTTTSEQDEPKSSGS